MSDANTALVKSSYDDVNNALEGLLNNVAGSSVTTEQVNQAVATAITNATANLVKSAAVDSTNNGVASVGVTKAGVPWFSDSTGATEYLLTNTYQGGNLPVGTVLAFGSNTIPSGYLLCNGASYSTTQYPALYAVIGTSTLPDLRGLFLRGLDTSGNVDNYYSSSGSTRTLFSFEEGSFVVGDTNYSVTALNGIDANNSSRIQGLASVMWDVPSSSSNKVGASYVNNTGITLAGPGQTEPLGVTRPKNSAVNYIMKAV